MVYYYIQCTYMYSFSGVCLLLAAKFLTDVKQRDVKSLVDVRHTDNMFCFLCLNSSCSASVRVLY